MHKLVAIIQGPKEYLKREVRVERFEITQEEIDECREGDESDAEVLEYITEEYCNEWAQRWCNVQLFTLAQYRIIDPTFEW